MSASLVLTSTGIIRNTSAYWQANDPVIPLDSAAYSTDTGFLRIGDGTKRWSQLQDFNASMYVPQHAARHGKDGDDRIWPAAIGAAAEDHTHPTDLTREAVGVAASLLNGHLNDADPHPQYMTSAEATSSTNSILAAHINEVNPHTQYSLTTHTHDYYTVGDTRQLVITRNVLNENAWNDNHILLISDARPKLGFWKPSVGAMGISLEDDGSLYLRNSGGAKAKILSPWDYGTERASTRIWSTASTLATLSAKLASLN